MILITSVGIIIGLSVLGYLYNLISRKINAPRVKLRNELYEQTKENSKLEKIITELRNEIEFLKEGISEKDELFNNLKLRDNETISKITTLYSDFLLIQYGYFRHLLLKYVFLKNFEKVKSRTRLKFSRRLKTLQYCNQTLILLKLDYSDCLLV